MLETVPNTSPHASATDILEYVGRSAASIDGFIMHQAKLVGSIAKARLSTGYDFGKSQAALESASKAITLGIGVRGELVTSRDHLKTVAADVGVDDSDMGCLVPMGTAEATVSPLRAVEPIAA